MANYTNHENNKPLSAEIRAEIETRFRNGEAKVQIAKNLGISHSVVRKYTTPLQWRITDSVKEEAIRLLDQGHSRSAIARALGITRGFVGNLRPDPKLRPVRIPDKTKALLVQRVQAGESVQAIARDLGLDAGNARLIVKARLRMPTDDEVEQIEQQLHDRKSGHKIAKDLKLPRQAIRNIAATRDASAAKGYGAKRFTDSDRLRMAQLVSKGLLIKDVKDICGATDTAIRKAYLSALKAGLVEPRIGLAMEDDRQLSRIQRLHPELEEWCTYAVQWYGIVGGNFAIVCSAINRFLGYLAKNELFPRPADYLLRQNAKLIPSFFEGECTKSDHGAGMNNAVVDFLDWILIQPEFADHDEDLGPTTLPIFRNPLNRASRSDHTSQRGSESNKQVMPYWMIHDLRRRIAQGPNFRDWVWVQGLGGKATLSGDKESRNWFPVDEARLDKSDPDCVWRVRQRLDKGPIVEMWSPVRWVACLLKLQTTARMGQIRMLDSGEADTFKVQDGALVENKSSIATGTPRKPRRQGAIRLTEGKNLVLYFNTNKTSDIGKVGAEKGQECPWPQFHEHPDDPHYWIEKLRSWQAKYNPPTGLISWKSVPSSRRLRGKSDIVCSTYLDAVFLLRTAESEAEAQFPVAAGTVDKAWQKLIAAYATILHTEGKRNPDGSSIQLVRDGRAEVTIHGLRVSLITHLILDGDMPPALMMKIVGHARFVMTVYYTKPGLQRIEDALAEAAGKIEATKDITLIRDLQSWSAEQIRDHVVFNAKELIDVIPLNPTDRNPLGWLPMHDGLCLAGGNAGPVNGDARFPGCHNGAIEITPGHGRHAGGPAPGGVRNCCRCRWKCSGKGHILGLHATFNNRQFHLHKASGAAIDAERMRNELLLEKASVEAEGQPFTRLGDLRMAERLYEAAMQRMQELALDVAAVHRMIERIKALPDDDEGNHALAAQGDLLTIQSVIEETDSDLLVLSEICAGVELYPDLDPGTAIFEYAQLLDMAFEREGKPLILARLSEKEKLIAANAIMRELERHADPNNPILARRKVINMMDRGESLQHTLGIDLNSLMNLAAMGTGSRALRLQAADMKEPNGDH